RSDLHRGRSRRVPGSPRLDGGAGWAVYSHIVTHRTRRTDSPRPARPDPRSLLMPADSLAEFELLVMLAALRLGPDEAYTVSIAEDIRERTGRRVRRANVFTTLQRLEAKGLVSTRLGEPRPERGGRPRRLVTVEPEGMAAVRATTSAIQAMVGELDGLLGEAG